MKCERKKEGERERKREGERERERGRQRGREKGKVNKRRALQYQEVFLLILTVQLKARSFQ